MSSDTPTTSNPPLDKAEVNFTFKIHNWPDKGEKSEITKVKGVEAINAKVIANRGHKYVMCLPHSKIKLIYISSSKYSDECKSLLCKLIPSGIHIPGGPQQYPGSSLPHYVPPPYDPYQPPLQDCSTDNLPNEFIKYPP